MSPDPTALLPVIQPEDGIVMGFQAKRPGANMRLATVKTRFSYEEALSGGGVGDRYANP